MKTFKHYQLLPYLSILSLLLTLCQAIDITKLPVLNVTTTGNSGPDQTRKIGEDLPVNTDYVPRFKYRLLVGDGTDSNNHNNDDHLLSLDCKPTTTDSFAFSLESPRGKNQNASIFLPHFQIKHKTYYQRVPNETGITREYTTVYNRRPEMDILMGDSQALALYQLELLRWEEEPASNFSTDEQVRAKQFKNQTYFVANDDEMSSSNSSPVYICLADDPTSEDGPAIGFLSPLDGLCKVVKFAAQRPPKRTASSTAAIVSRARHPYYLLTRQGQNVTYTWLEIATNTSTNLQNWTAPPNAFPMRVDRNKTETEHLPPSVYIARFRPVNTSNLIILGLQRGAPFPALGSGKLELLTVKETPEVPFQVMLRLAGHSHPLNSRAKVWQDYLQCSLFNSSASATADKIDERLLLSWRSEQLAAPKLNLHEEASVTQFSANEELVLQHKVTTWKIYQQLYSDFSSGNFYFWGEGFNGSLFTYNRPFYALFKHDSEERSNYASGFRPICRANEGNSWVPGFLNMRTGRCLASGLNGTVISSLDYKVLYHFYQRPQADRQQWVPYQRNLTAISVRGAIYADFSFFGERPRVLIARLKVLITGESSGQNGTHRMLYGSLAAGQNVFRYVEEGSTEEGHVTHAIEGAEEKGAQILVISD